MTQYEQPFPEAEQPSFDDLMTQAQDLHGQGQFTDAQHVWQQAVGMAPDVIEKARAIRGDAASAHQLANTAYALNRATAAHLIHDQAVSSTTQYNSPERTRALRERAQSASLLGRIVVSSLATRERSDIISTNNARHQSKRGLGLFDEALRDITVVEKSTGASDQYRINALSHAAIAHSLYGNEQTASSAAAEARKLAWTSESGPTAANISASHRARAVVRAVVRAYTASAVHLLTTPHESMRRSLALKIATHRKLGL